MNKRISLIFTHFKPSCPYFRLKIKFIYLAHRKGSEGVRVGGSGETGLRGREDVPKVKST